MATKIRINDDDGASASALVNGPTCCEVYADYINDLVLYVSWLVCLIGHVIVVYYAAAGYQTIKFETTAVQIFLVSVIIHSICLILRSLQALVCLVIYGRDADDGSERWNSMLTSLIGTPVCCAFLFMLVLAIIITTLAWRDDTAMANDGDSLSIVKSWMIGYWVYLCLWTTMSCVVYHRAKMYLVTRAQPK